jgi:FMN phosphatase YigB (HAD superfamily)
MRKELDAVAFDLDGTLYPNRRFFVKLLPFLVRHHKLLRAMGKARNVLRETPHIGGFYDAQAALMAEQLNLPAEYVKQLSERLIYRGWEPLFTTIKLFKGVPETITAIKDSGLKLGLLSDFPPLTKLENLGISDLWDVVLCSEEVGRLKPAPDSFLALARELGTVPERVLYVGNSLRYDVYGAKGVGMKTALVSSRSVHRDEADFVFSNYSQLRHFLLA